MSTRSFGNKLEDHVVNLAEDKYDIKLKKFINSGAKNQNDSDFQDENFQFECKRNGTNNKIGLNDLKFSTKEWNKVKKESMMRRRKPAMVNGCNDLSKSTVTIRLDDFMTLYKAYLNSLEG